MNTTENNKIIAEFMGNRNYLYNNDKSSMYFILTNTAGEELIVNYDNDWGLLMEVVEKIESIGYWIEILGGVHNVCRIGITNNIEDFICLDNETKIEAVYNTCVTFIEWYNKQNSAQNN